MALAVGLTWIGKTADRRRLTNAQGDIQILYYLHVRRGAPGARLEEYEQITFTIVKHFTCPREFSIVPRILVGVLGCCQAILLLFFYLLGVVLVLALFAG